MEKECQRCKEVSPYSNFCVKAENRDKLSKTCKICKSEEQKVYRTRIDKIVREYIDKQKRKPCFDCKISYETYVMDFDHINKKDKLFSVSKARGKQFSLKKVQEEINKCELVCANCHRIRTYKKEELKNGNI